MITYRHAHAYPDRLYEQQGPGGGVAAVAHHSNGFSETNMFDALYETLDRTSRIEGTKVHHPDRVGAGYLLEADAGTR